MKKTITHQFVKYKTGLPFDNLVDPITRVDFVAGESLVSCDTRNSLLSLQSLKWSNYECPFCGQKLNKDLTRRLCVFLCHAHADRDAVRKLYTRLSKDGVDVWLDKEKLMPGQNWETEIRKAVRGADVVMVCLSKQFNQAGFRQKEVKLALDVARSKPEGENFILPVRIEEAESLPSLEKWHWVDLFESGGYKKVIHALQASAELIGVTVTPQKKHTPRLVLLSQWSKKKRKVYPETSSVSASKKTNTNNEKQNSNHKPPKVFISYAWEDDVRKWSRDLASRLRADGVETILDQWFAVPGDQLPQFMEKSVKTSDFVLIICTPKYKKKTDGRQGGVGYEGDVITNELLIKRNHRKFIPVLCKGKWIVSAPTWVSGKFYVNLTDENKFADDDYKALLRALHGKSQTPPPVGNAPKDL